MGKSSEIDPADHRGEEELRGAGRKKRGTMGIDRSAGFTSQRPEVARKEESPGRDLEGEARWRGAVFHSRRGRDLEG
jgi:hypothetical protein